MLPSSFLKFVGASLIIIGAYDTNVYRYAVTKGVGTFDFFGRELPAKHPIVRLGFMTVLIFYYAAGAILLALG